MLGPQSVVALVIFPVVYPCGISNSRGAQNAFFITLSLSIAALCT